MRWAAWGAIGAGVVCAIGVCASCSDVQTHVYGAQLYEQTNACLDDYAALDVVTGGTGSARCAPTCLVGGASYYVSTMCAPYPASLTANAQWIGNAAVAATPGTPIDPVCAAALVAGSCSAPVDAGGDGGDAAGDDGRDAADGAGDDSGDAAGDDSGDDGGGDAGDGGDAAG
jgi:hypothetical protein